MATSAREQNLAGLRARIVASTKPQAEQAPKEEDKTDQVLGKRKHGLAMEGVRIVAFSVYFITSITAIHIAQFLGLPLYAYNRSWYNAWVALTKQYFGVHITTMTYWWSPTVVRISGDKSVAGLIRQNEDGLVSLNFGERGLFIANHQLYTDWLYLWWAAYTNNPPMHGHIYIILKETLKWVPIVGPAMQLYGFIFMTRSWADDQTRLRQGLQHLNSQRSTSIIPGQGSAPAQLDPMWLLIFPEGTNLSADEVKKSRDYAAKVGKEPLTHQVLPRPAGLHLLLQELGETVPYLYDCTIGYTPLPPDGYGNEIYGLRTVYIQGRPPQSVNMHWRRYKTSEIPIGSKAELNDWLEARWREKETLLENFYATGKFSPADKSAVQIEDGPTEDEFKTPYITTEVRPVSSAEYLSIFAPVAVAAVAGRILWQVASRMLHW